MKRRQKVSFENQRGHQLSALLEMPLDMDPYAIAIFAHCFTCNKNFSAMRNISKALQANDIAVLRFDFTGLGESEGEFSDTTFTTNLDDLIVSADYMRNLFPNRKLILVGHSLGGAAVIHAANKIKDLAAVVTVASPYEAHHVTHLLDHRLSELEEKGSTEINLGGKPVRIGKQFIDDINKTSAIEAIEKIRKPILILHSPQDRVVEIDNAAKIYHAAHHPKSFVSIEGADHLLSNAEDSLYVGEVISTWVKRYIPRPSEDDIESSSKNAVRLNDDDGLASDVKSGIHRLKADEPESAGGTNSGPDPYDFLSIGLASCTAMTLQLYAKRKNWNLASVIVHVDHVKKHKEDCDNCEEPKSRIDVFKKKIEIHGDLSNEQKSRLLEIADRCPVHRTLHSEISIVTELIS